MRRTCFGSAITILAAAVVSVIVPVSVSGQVPGASAAQANLPRTSDGQPDIQGIWNPAAAGASHSLEEGSEPAQDRVTSDGPRASTLAARRGELSVKVTVEPDGKLPYQPWAAARRLENLANIHTPTKWAHLDPEDRCLLNGVPRSNYRGAMQILQTPGYVAILYEWTHAYRVIPLDGRPHPSAGIRLWNGDSRGRWKGNTLVVDVANFLTDPVEFNMQPWFDSHGTFFSDALHVIEHWTFVDANTIRYEATIEDPKVFTRPWQLAMTINRNRQQGFELLEEACVEGDRNTPLMLDVGRKAKAAGRTGIHSHDEQ